MVKVLVLCLAVCSGTLLMSTFCFFNSIGLNKALDYSIVFLLQFLYATLANCFRVQFWQEIS